MESFGRWTASDLDAVFGEIASPDVGEGEPSVVVLVADPAERGEAEREIGPKASA